MRFATWNVNSLKARLPRVLGWLEEHQPDVLCIQETKMKNEAFPADALAEAGYESAHFGQGQWNGVAILSRVGISDVTTGFGDGPDAYSGDARCIAATCADVRFVNLYVPNGREVATDYYERKLTWFEQLADWLQANYVPSAPLVVLGDFNVAPEDRDVWDIAAFAGATHVTAKERTALDRLTQWGLTDAFRALHPDETSFTFWDYRGGDFHKGHGMRIDLALVSAPVAAQLAMATVDRNARKGSQPSDHAPLMVELRSDN
ncbi:MAG: exodeoxyribonuclease III [Acidimicrobiia bacterium]